MKYDTKLPILEPTPRRLLFLAIFILMLGVTLQTNQQWIGFFIFCLLCGGLNAIVTWYKRRVTPLFKEEVVAQDRVYFYIRSTGHWFEGIYIEEDEQSITFLTDEGIVKQLPKIYEQSNEEEEPCSRCGGNGYIEVGFEQFQNCSDECVSRAEGEADAIEERYIQQRLAEWLRSECPYCKTVQRNCQCTDIPF